MRSRSLALPFGPGGEDHLLRQLAARRSPILPRKVDKPLVLYGAGNLGRMAKEYFDRIGVSIRCVVDQDAEKRRAEPFWSDSELLPPQAVTEEQRRGSLLAVCIATSPYAPLEASLQGAGWADPVPFYDIAEAYRDIHPLGNGWFTAPLSDHEREAVGDVLRVWSDDVSRAHHLQFLAWRVLREEWIFEEAPVVTDNRFFIPELLGALGDDESFLDVGAHHGEVSRRFLQTVGDRFTRVWLLEPDPGNLAQARRALEGGGERLRFIERAVAASSGTRSFYPGLGLASQLCEFGPEQVEVTTIDELQLAPSFIKLHIEGGELGALQGAMQTVIRHRPLIAATAYHNSLGIWRLPQYLMDRLPQYRFIFRLHGWCGTGATLYAIPDERR